MFDTSQTTPQAPHPDRVRAWMSRPAIRVAPDTPLEEAFRLMREHDVRHLLVMEGGDVGATLVGIVTDRDLRRPSTDNRLWSLQDMYLLGDDLKVKDVMTRHPFLVRPEHTVSQAAGLMIQHKIGALPVVDEDDIIVGIVTTTDLLAALVALGGLSPGR